MQDQLDSLESYMSAIKGVQHLTPAEEKTLAAAMMNGDVTAAHKVIKSHLLWVVKIAHKYKGFGLTLQELISAGNAGLLHATEMFDPSKGARLSTYSKWWVKEFIQKALENESSTIRVPAEMSERLSQIEATRTKLRHELGRDPNDQEVADEIGLSKRKIKVVTHVANRGSNRGKVSMDAKVTGDDKGGSDTTFNDFFADENAETSFEKVSHLEDLQRIDLLFANLNDEEKFILIQRYGLDGSEPKTLREIAENDGRSKQRISQIQEAALKKLKFWYGEEPMQMTA